MRPLLFLLLTGLLLPSLLQAATPRVLVSIKPIHSLTTAVMAGVATPQLLISGAGSPHGYALRPSEARLINEADMVIWVGEELESFLVRPLLNLPQETVSISLTAGLPQHLLPVRAGGTWEGHDHAHDDHEHSGEHHDDHAPKDPHLWTSPLVARDIVRLIADGLMAMDPAHADTYAGNAAELIARLEAFHLELRARLQPVADVPYIVFHDAYQYFERDFAVNAIGSVTVDAERAPGVKRVMEIRDKIRELDARAVFSEPQFQSRIVTTIIEGTGARTGILDPMGTDLPAGSETYFILVRQLADELLRVLR